MVIVDKRKNIPYIDFGDLKIGDVFWCGDEVICYYIKINNSFTEGNAFNLTDDYVSLFAFPNIPVTKVNAEIILKD